MNDARKTKTELIKELDALRTRCAYIEEAESGCQASPGESPKQLTWLARAASAGFWVVDTDFVIRIANRVMCQLSGQQPGEIVGKKCYEVLPSPACHTESCTMRRAFWRGSTQAGGAHDSEVGKIPADCRVISSVLADQTGDSFGVLGELVTCSDANMVIGENRSTTPQRRVAAVARNVPAGRGDCGRTGADATGAVLRAFEAASRIAKRLSEAHAADVAVLAHAQELIRLCEAGREAASHAFGPPAGTWVPIHSTKPTAPAEPQLSSRRVVLVVIAQDMLRTAVRRGLEARGYCVISASRCDEARDLLAARGRSVDAIVLDIQGCHGEGHAELDEFRRIDARVPFVLVLDRQDRKLLRRAGCDTSLRLLHKPIEPRELARQIEEAIRRTSTSSHPRAR